MRYPTLPDCAPLCNVTAPILLAYEYF